MHMGSRLHRTRPWLTCAQPRRTQPNTQANANVTEDGPEGWEEGETGELPPFPDEDDPKFPQENADYFRRKNYVRKDKYSLEWFLRPDDPNAKLPSILECFGGE